MSEHIKVAETDDVLAITLARPERRNAITNDMYDRMAELLEYVWSNPAIRLITIQGEGDDFAAGNDLAEFLDPQPRKDYVPVWRFLNWLAKCEVPIVAAVHGNCVGIGTTMLLHCDLVIAEEGTRFSLPFVDLGLVPEAASSLLLPLLAGRRFAARALLLGEPFGVDEAEAIGLISHRAATGTLNEMRDAIVAALLAKPAEALRQTQRLLREGQQAEVLERMKLEGGLFAERLQSAEVKEAIAAFFAKRRPST